MLKALDRTQVDSVIMGLQQYGQQPKTALNNELPKTTLPSLALPDRTETVYRGIRHPDGHCEVCVDEPSFATPF